MCLSANLKIRIYNHKLHYLLAIILSLHNVGAFFSSTMTRKPTHLTHINAIINRYDVLHPFEKTFATVHWVRLDLACHSFSTKVKGFLLQNFHILGNQGILFTAYLPPIPSSLKRQESFWRTFAKYTHAQQHS